MLMLFGTTLLVLGNIAVSALIADALSTDITDTNILPEPVSI